MDRRLINHRLVDEQRRIIIIDLKMYTDGYPYADWGSNPPLADHRLMLKPMGPTSGQALEAVRRQTA